MGFSENLKQKREERGISKAELARRFGLSRSMITLYETGARAPSFEIFCRMCDFFDCDLSADEAGQRVSNTGQTVSIFRDLAEYAGYDIAVDNSGRTIVRIGKEKLAITAETAGQIMNQVRRHLRFELEEIRNGREET